MKLKRFWADNIEVPDFWDEPLQLAKHRIYMSFAGSENIGCDENGFRIPDGFNSLINKYQSTKGNYLIFCFGGSTTFGSYCQYNESFPSYLDNLFDNNISVFNLGLIGSDIKGSLYTLLYILRLGMVPDLAIFLDGINEKQAWFQAKNGYNEYEELDYQYHPFLRLIEKANRYKNISSYIYSIMKNFKTKKKKDHGNKDYLQFVTNQSYSYIKTKDTIDKLANEWSFKTIYFLQPTLFDFIQDQIEDESRLRHEYLKSVYRSILSKSKNKVIDISNHIDLTPELFIDWQHCNGQGNKILAQKIKKYIYL